MSVQDMALDPNFAPENKEFLFIYFTSYYILEVKNSILCPRPGARCFGRSIDLLKKSVPKALWVAMRSAQFTPLQASDRV